MTNKQTEQEVRRTFADVTPNELDNIRAECPTRVAAKTAKQPSVKGWKWATCAMAVVLVAALVCCGVVLGVNGSGSAVAATVTLDVNPSVEIKLNKNQRVVEVTALNADGVAIIGTMDLKNMQLEAAVNALIGSMFREGYFAQNNSVLVSVDAAQNLYDQIVNAVTSEITVYLQDKKIEANVLSQWITESDAAKSIAKKYGISLGKAELINKILANSPEGNYTVEQLAKLTVSQLNLIIETLDIQDLLHGNAPREYIDKDEAIDNALQRASENLQASVTRDDVRALQCKMDYEDGRMVYEVEFIYDTWEFDVDVDAATGAIIKMDKEVADEHSVVDPGRTKLTQEEVMNMVRQLLDLPATEWFQVTYDRKDGVFEVKVNPNKGKFYQIEINDYGDIVSWKEEDIEIMPGPSGEWETQGQAPGDQYAQIWQCVIKFLQSKLKDYDGNIQDTEVEIDYKNNMTVYELEFNFRYQGVLYECECEVAVNTLEILRCKYEIDD